jgi:hypothetical protein
MNDKYKEYRSYESPFEYLIAELKSFEDISKSEFNVATKDLKRFFVDKDCIGSLNFINGKRFGGLLVMQK